MSTPSGLGKRGRALWGTLNVDAATPDGVLALEACRAADRLDELDRIIAGKGVLKLMRLRLELDELMGNPAATVTVKFDSVLGEARQLQGVLRQMLVTLADRDGGSGAKPAKTVEQPASAVDEFTARRRGRAGA